MMQALVNHADVITVRVFSIVEEFVSAPNGAVATISPPIVQPAFGFGNLGSAAWLSSRMAPLGAGTTEDIRNVGTEKHIFFI
jgi:hypothetical protein